MSSHTTVFQNGVPVANAVANVAFNKANKVVSFGSSFVKPCASCRAFLALCCFADLFPPQPTSPLPRLPFLPPTRYPRLKASSGGRTTGTRRRSNMSRSRMARLLSPTLCRFGTTARRCGTRRSWTHTRATSSSSPTSSLMRRWVSSFGATEGAAHAHDNLNSTAFCLSPSKPSCKASRPS